MSTTLLAMSKLTLPVRQAGIRENELMKECALLH